MHYRATVNDQFNFEEADFREIDIIPVAENQFHIIEGNVAYQFEVLAINYSEKSFLLKTNGNKYEVKLKDQYDQLVQKLGLSLSSSQKIKEIKAPMPGLVLELKTDVGQTVQKGDPLLILEAMKMENVIKSPGEGVVKFIQINKGAVVDKGQVLIEME